MRLGRLLITVVLLALAGRTFADNLSVETVVMGAGETKEVAIVLNNPNKQYVAFQFEVVLPDGITFALNDKGKPIVSLDANRADDHSLNVKDLGNNTYRLLAFSMTNAAFAGTNGALVNMTLKTAADITAGAKTVSITGQTFTEASAAQVKWSDMSFTVQVLSAVTIKADDKTMVYGEENPEWTYTVTNGQVYGDGTPVVNCAATATSPAGSYDITVEKGTVQNPTMLTKGTLTITKAPLTVTAGSYTMKQGDQLPSFEVSYEGFKNGETASVLSTQPTITCAATSASEPGTYDITVSGAEAANYEISYVKGTLTVTAADPVTVTAKSYTITYGDALPTFEFESTGVALIGTPEISCEATSTSPVGTYPITISKGSVTNYNDSYVNGTLTITKAPLTITAKSYTKKQGEDNPTFEVEYSGFKNGETASVLTTKPTMTTTATSASEPGTYEITVSGAEAGNYDISYVKGTLTVVAADALVVTANSYTITYGDALPKFEYTSSGAAINGTPTITCTATATSPVGTYPITISKGSVTNYNDSYVNGTLTITKAPLTITAKSYTQKQGEKNPTFEVEYSGFKNGETASVLSTQPTVTCAATSASEPGTYEITVSGAEAGNYDISYVKGTLTVVAADALVVTANSYTITYGDALPTFEYTSSGAAISGTPTITCEATASSPVGTYPITISKGSVTNYNDSYVNGTLTITKAPLTITAKSYTKKQGDENPTFEVEYSGFKNNETASVLSTQPTISCSATKASAPGSYDITVSGVVAQNYDITYIKGTLTVVAADGVVVTAKSYTREYGESNPTFEYDAVGAELNGTPEISCEATATSPVGTYPITISKGSVSNYNDSYVNGILTITKAPLTIKAENYTIEQGEDLPNFAVSYEGFKNNETENVLSELPTVSCSASSASGPGEYTINVSGAKAQNYEITYEAGTLTITTASPVTVTAKSYSREYGEENPRFEYDVEGATLDGEPEISCEATPTSPVGTYPIVIKKGSVTNGNDLYVNGTLTITKAPLTIKAKSYTKKQGEENPTLEVEYSGFKNNETESVLTTKPTVKTMATKTSATGTYDITVSGASAANYEISYVKGTLTVVAAEDVIITARNYTRVYGEENPEFEYDAVGAELNGEPELSCAATATSPVGTYPIVVKDGSVTNYNAKYVNGTLTIVQAPLIVKANSYMKKQGEDNPAFEIVYEGWKLQDTESVLLKKPVAITTATKDSPSGVYDIAIIGGNAQNYELIYISGKLTVVDTNSINGAALNDKGQMINDEWYDLNGRRISQPKKGVNIHRVSNGKAKVFVIK